MYIVHLNRLLRCDRCERIASLYTTMIVIRTFYYNNVRGGEKIKYIIHICSKTILYL